jgi:hypothetical protein
VSVSVLVLVLVLVFGGGGGERVKRASDENGNGRQTEAGYVRRGKAMRCVTINAGGPRARNRPRERERRLEMYFGRDTINVISSS